MTDESRIWQKADLLRVLKRAGIPPDVIAALDGELPDEVDLDKYGPLLQAHGVTRDEVINRMGGSP